MNTLFLTCPVLRFVHAEQKCIKHEQIVIPAFVYSTVFHKTEFHETHNCIGSLCVDLLYEFQNLWKVETNIFGPLH